MIRSRAARKPLRAGYLTNRDAGRVPWHAPDPFWQHPVPAGCSARKFGCNHGEAPRVRWVLASEGEPMDGVTAVREAYQAHYRRLVGQLYALTGSLPEAQDVVHEAYARALARPARFLAVDDPETWLRTVAMNLARTRFRRRWMFDRLLRSGRVLASRPDWRSCPSGGAPVRPEHESRGQGGQDGADQRCHDEDPELGQCASPLEERWSE